MVHLNFSPSKFNPQHHECTHNYMHLFLGVNKFLLVEMGFYIHKVTVPTKFPGSAFLIGHPGPQIISWGWLLLINMLLRVGT